MGNKYYWQVSKHSLRVIMNAVDVKRLNLTPADRKFIRSAYERHACGLPLHELMFCIDTADGLKAYIIHEPSFKRRQELLLNDRI